MHQTIYQASATKYCYPLLAQKTENKEGNRVAKVFQELFEAYKYPKQRFNRIFLDRIKKMLKNG
ncbi:hypothetical protein D3C87_153680 [compost metagenome]